MTINKEQPVSDAVEELVARSIGPMRAALADGYDDETALRTAFEWAGVDALLAASHPLEQQQAVSGDELLPCPFCGGEAQRGTIGDDEPNNAGGDVICCTRCQASSHVEFGRKENLVSCWNSRAALTASGMGRMGELEAFAKAVPDGSANELCPWCLSCDHWAGRVELCPAPASRAISTALQEEGVERRD